MKWWNWSVVYPLTQAFIFIISDLNNEMELIFQLILSWILTYAIMYIKKQRRKAFLLIYIIE